MVYSSLGGAARLLGYNAPTQEDRIMANRMTPAQFRSRVAQLQQRQRQAISAYNNAARRYNSEVRHAVAEYNRAVSARNARVRANRQRLWTEFGRLSSRKTVRHVAYHASVVTLRRSFSFVETAVADGRWPGDHHELFAMAEDEAANAAALFNRLEDGGHDGNVEELALKQTSILGELTAFGSDLPSRWNGALYALSASNPDAARHFCTSSRELLDRILVIEAPDTAVLGALPGAETTSDGRPTRRERIRYCLTRRGRDLDGLSSFVDADIANVLELFRTFNDGTHGSAGRYSIAELEAVKHRVENAIRFLYRAIRA
jgi:hypothetical protein